MYVSTIGQPPRGNPAGTVPSSFQFAKSAFVARAFLQVRSLAVDEFVARRWARSTPWAPER
jgi:hypothetical protein